MITYKIIAAYVLAYYIVYFMMINSRLVVITLRVAQKQNFVFGPINGIPFILALKGYANFQAECRQLGYTSIIGTALNLVLGFFG